MSETGAGDADKKGIQLIEGKLSQLEGKHSVVGMHEMKSNQIESGFFKRMD